VSQQRIRRPAEESKRLILDAAEQLLIEGGPRAVQVRSVAQRVGITDAGVSHHFGGRDRLLVALLRHGGRRLRAAVEAAVSSWIDREPDLAALVDAIAEVYRDGYAELAIALHAAGWRDTGGGLLEPVVEALHAARRRSRSRADVEDTRLAVAALHQALALEPVYGAAFRRSAGVAARAAIDPSPQLAWWTATTAAALGLEG
jgi:TetR/AcrR family transcriptional regulator, repressor for neighboring sulfatase